MHKSVHNSVINRKRAQRSMLSELKFDHWRHVRKCIAPAFSAPSLRQVSYYIGTKKFNICTVHLYDFIQLSTYVQSNILVL